MTFYHVDNGTILSGPHDAQSTYVKKLTHCGNPDALPSLLPYGLLPEERATLQPWQEYGTPVVNGNVVTVPVGADRAVEVECLSSVDLAAESARQRLVSYGPWCSQEYLFAYDDALSYQQAGFSGEVPPGVSTWAIAQGWTNQQAAEDILYQRALWKDASDAVRGIRLNGKAAIRNATTAADKWAAMEAAVSSLNALFVG